ncbi:MAG: hypothetical protein EPN47_03440 [Acidobacteria bacterium]|nr:MAG: hypothetical protein EPN47_03440 [Acidobacteriota bacterium]
MKNLTETKHTKTDLGQLDESELKRRAAEDAFKDADSYAVAARSQSNTAPSVKRVNPVSYLIKGKQLRVSVDPPEGIDGVLVRANDSRASLVLSDELLQASLAVEIATLVDEPIRIFHVQGQTPWVEQVLVGKA